MANPINPETGKPFRGRPKRQWANGPENGNDSDNRNSIGIEHSGSAFGNDEHGNNQRGNPEIGRNSGQPEPGKSETPTGFTVGEEADIRVEKPLPWNRPKNKPPANTNKPRETKSKSKESGFITPQHVEGWITQGFAFIAMAKGADYWAIHHPDIEVRPWAPSAAELLNKIPADQAQKLTELNAAIAVTVGMAMLVSSRMRMDRMVRLQAVRAKREELQRQEGTPDSRPTMPNPDQPAQPGQTRQTRPNQNGSGARSVHPPTPIFGRQEGIE